MDDNGVPDDGAARPRWDRRVREVLDRMSLAEKVAQLCAVVLPADDTPPVGPVPGLLLVPAAPGPAVAERVRRFQEAFSTGSETPAVPALPLAVGPEAMLRFPGTLGAAATWDLACVERAAADTAAALRGSGLYGVLAGSGTTGDNGPTAGLLTVDTVLGSAVAGAQVRGAQGRDAGRVGRIAADRVAFAVVAGNSRDGSWHERTLRSTVLAAAESAVRAGAAIVVPSAASNAGVPGHTDSWLLRGVLRGEWGFGGAVVAVPGAVDELVTRHRVARSTTEALASVVEGGVDVVGTGADTCRHVLDLLESGALPEWLVDEAAAAVLQVKYRLGLLDRPGRGARPAEQPADADDLPAVRAGLRSVTRSLVLLSDPGGALPLPASGTVDVVTADPGPAGDADGGGWNGDGMPWAVGPDGHRFAAVTSSAEPDVLELAQALKSQLPSVLVRAGAMPDLTSRGEAGDTVVIVAGDPRAAAGPAGRVVASGRSCVVLVCSDRVDRLDELATTTASVVLCWGPVERHADVVAEMLVGLTEPEGRLPLALPVTPSTLSVSYPLGHGNGYTSFHYSRLRVAPAVLLGRETIRVRCVVTNTGQRAGREIVQVYVGPRTGSVATPGRTLAGFATVRLAAGQSLPVTVAIPPERLATWDRAMRHVLHPGSVEVLVGRSAADIRLTGTLTVSSTGAVRG